MTIGPKGVAKIFQDDAVIVWSADVCVGKSVVWKDPCGGYVSTVGGLFKSMHSAGLLLFVVCAPSSSHVCPANTASLIALCVLTTRSTCPCAKTVTWCVSIRISPSSFRLAVACAVAHGVSGAGMATARERGEGGKYKWQAANLKQRPKEARLKPSQGGITPNRVRRILEIGG